MGFGEFRGYRGRCRTASDNEACLHVAPQDRHEPGLRYSAFWIEQTIWGCQSSEKRPQQAGRAPSGQALLACHMQGGDRLPKPRRRVLALPRLRQDFGGQAGDGPSRKEKQDRRTHSKEPRAGFTDLKRQRYRLRLPRGEGASRSVLPCCARPCPTPASRWPKCHDGADGNGKASRCTHPCPANIKRSTER